MTRTLLRRISWWCAAVAAAATFGSQVDAGDRLTLTVTPAMSYAPATVHIEVRFEPSAATRVLEIEAESESFFRSSFVELGGEGAPRVVAVNFRGLPSGQYEIKGVLKNAGGHEVGCARQPAMVIASGPER